MIGRGWILRGVLVPAVLSLAGCAQIEPPPGGPEDRTPPNLVMQQPDTLAVVPGWRRPVVFRFSERISEQQVEQSVMVSPRTSPVLVDRGSREIRVSLRNGWVPGTIYQVTVQPLIQDLFNNRLAEPVRIVFSTGPAIPATRLAGLVRDRITGDPQVDARVEAIRVADSLVYAVPSDSLGRFELEYIPEGDYLVRAYTDQNLNRALDPLEPRDSLTASITAADSSSVELSMVMPDSTPPVIASTTATGQGRVDIRFDDYLDPAQELTPAAVTLTGPDGSVVPIDTVTIGEPPPAEDTTAAEVVEPGARGRPEADAQPEPILPAQLVVVQLPEGVQLTPEAEYTVVVTGVRNVVGLSGDSEAQFTAPPPPPPPAVEEPDTVTSGDPGPDAETDPEPEQMTP